MVLKDPVGVVAAFTPWNFPINQVVRKMSAALVTGCAMIVKAPEETPAAPTALAGKHMKRLTMELVATRRSSSAKTRTSPWRSRPQGCQVHARRHRARRTGRPWRRAHRQRGQFLAGYAFTRLLKNADLLARRVEVGMLWVNMPAMPSAEMPFGGIKDSGYGSEGGPEAMEACLNTRAVTIANV